MRRPLRIGAAHTVVGPMLPVVAVAATTEAAGATTATVGNHESTTAAGAATCMLVSLLFLLLLRFHDDHLKSRELVLISVGATLPIVNFSVLLVFVRRQLKGFVAPC